MTTITKQFSQDQLDAIYDSLVYLIETNEDNYHEYLEEHGEGSNHIYTLALQALNAIKG